MKQDRHNDHANTTRNCEMEAASSFKAREMTETNIKSLEEIEGRLLNQMQQTMARKQAAVQKLEEKSKALKNNIQPRNAYRKSTKGGVDSESGYAEE